MNKRKTIDEEISTVQQFDMKIENRDINICDIDSLCNLFGDMNMSKLQEKVNSIIDCEVTNAPDCMKFVSLTFEKTINTQKSQLDRGYTINLSEFTATIDNETMRKVDEDHEDISYEQIIEQYDLTTAATVAEIIEMENSCNISLFFKSLSHFNWLQHLETFTDMKLPKQQFFTDLIKNGYNKFDIRGSSFANTLDHLRIIGGIKKQDLYNGTTISGENILVPSSLFVAYYIKKHASDLHSRLFKNFKHFDSGEKVLEIKKSFFDEVIDTLFDKTISCIFYENLFTDQLYLTMNKNDKDYNAELDDNVSINIKIHKSFVVWKKDVKNLNIQNKDNSNVYFDKLYKKVGNKLEVIDVQEIGIQKKNKKIKPQNHRKRKENFK